MEYAVLLASVVRTGALLFLVVAESGLAVLSLYLLMLTVASCRSRSSTERRTTRLHRFAILIPAHNEEMLLGSLIHSLRRVAYPAEHYDIHVVADNCTDTTVEVGRRAGASVHERI